MTPSPSVDPVRERTVVTEAAMLRALYSQYQQRRMVNAVVPHVPLGMSNSTNWRGLAADTETIRFIDALVLFGDKRWAVEIKISKGDLQRELDNPAKSELWRAHTHSFYIMVPADLLLHALEVVPKHFGVMTNGYPVIVRRSPTNRAPLDLPYDTWRCVARKYGAACFSSAAGLGVTP